MATIVKPVEQKTKHLDYFLSQCHRRRYPAKSTIIYAGDKSDSLFYIVKGSVTVIIEDDDGREMIMAYLNAGDFFGEMGLFDNMDSRSAWVKAKTECEVAEISYTKFREIAQQDPRVLYFIGEQMASRLRQADQDHAPGNRADRRLFPGDGWSGAENAGGSGTGARQGQDHGGLRHALSVFTVHPVFEKTAINSGLFAFGSHHPGRL